MSVDDIRARRAAITPGVWYVDGLNICSRWSDSLGDDDSTICEMGGSDADAAFIAAAPADIDTLLASVAALTAERDALTAQLAQAQRELAAVPVDAIRKMRFDAEVELHGYTNAELDEWLDAEQDTANAAAELRAPTYGGGCW